MYNVESEDIKDILEEAVVEGYVTCRGCGMLIEMDTHHCPECLWKNPAYNFV